MPPTPDRVEEGRLFLEFIWRSVAERVVELAIDVYGLTEDQAAALRRGILRPADFRVLVD
jgi:hypothetical protein